MQFDTEARAFSGHADRNISDSFQYVYCAAGKHGYASLAISNLPLRSVRSNERDRIVLPIRVCHLAPCAASIWRATAPLMQGSISSPRDENRPLRALNESPPLITLAAFHTVTRLRACTSSLPNQGALADFPSHRQRYRHY